VDTFHRFGRRIPAARPVADQLHALEPVPRREVEHLPDRVVFVILAGAGLETIQPDGGLPLLSRGLAKSRECVTDAANEVTTGVASTFSALRRSIDEFTAREALIDLVLHFTHGALMYSCPPQGKHIFEASPGFKGCSNEFGPQSVPGAEIVAEAEQGPGHARGHQGHEHQHGEDGRGDDAEVVADVQGDELDQAAGVH
jgi:hypothetical protein